MPALSILTLGRVKVAAPWRPANPPPAPLRLYSWPRHPPPPPVGRMPCHRAATRESPQSPCPPRILDCHKSHPQNEPVHQPARGIANSFPLFPAQPSPSPPPAGTCPDKPVRPRPGAAPAMRATHRAANIGMDKSNCLPATSPRPPDKGFPGRSGNTDQPPRHNPVPPASATRTTANPPSSPPRITVGTARHPDLHSAKPAFRLPPRPAAVRSKKFARDRGAKTRSARAQSVRDTFPQRMQNADRRMKPIPIFTIGDDVSL